MEVYGFTEVGEALRQAGYHSEWINDALIDGMDYYALGFSTGGIIDVGKRQVLAEFQFDFSSGRIRLEELTVHLLNAKVSELQLPDLNQTYLERDQAASMVYHDLIPFKEVYKELEQKSLNQKVMNLNNLEDLKEQMKALGFKDKLIEQMEEKIKKDVPDFKLRDTLPATKGQVDLTLHFKQSGQSDFYYFNKFEASRNMGKPLEEGQKYLVISPNPEKQGENLFKKFENVGEAITFFKEQKGSSELAIGKDAAHKTMVATMEKDKVNYVAKDFNQTYYAKPVSQTFWIERGKGFSAEQASNLVQGRAVYRDDMMNLGGESYKAWIKLDIDKGKEKGNNFSTNQYHDPSYGFHLTEALDKYKIKEMEDPAKAVLLEASLRNGNRPLITVEKDGQLVKLHVEAVPRYSQLNMYAENGKPEKREQFLKQPEVDKTVAQGKGKEKEPELAESQGMKR
jgi:hypothetical protein